jgi:tryptophan synthase alpha subunit
MIVSVARRSGLKTAAVEADGVVIGSIIVRQMRINIRIPHDA